MIRASELDSRPTAAIAVAFPRQRRRQHLVQLLERAGYRVQQCTRLQELLELLDDVALIIMDAALPPGGLAACDAVRAVATMPIIVTGVQLGEEEAIRLLDHGADNALREPVGEGELLARVRAQLRRHTLQRRASRLVLGAGRVLDLDNSTLLAGSHVLSLTPTETRLMKALASRLGRPYPVRELVEAVWGKSYLAASQTDIVRANIYRLRRKLEVDPREPRLLTFVPGEGWLLRRLPEPAAEPAPASIQPAATTSRR